MIFINSLKLFGSNWGKALKFLLYYVVIWGLCFALFLPVFFEFKDMVVSNFEAANILDSISGVIQGSFGGNIHNFIHTTYATILEAFTANLGMAIYGLVVLFVFLPFFANVGKYTFNKMLYSYMTSKNQVGFFNAFIGSLKNSVCFALCRTLYNLVFMGITLSTIYGFGLIENEMFISYFLPLVEFLVLVFFFTLNQLTVLGWAPAMIVFDSNVFKAYGKGYKAVKRHFWAVFGTTLLYFFIFWGITMLLGFYAMIAMIPLFSILLCVYNMISFFASQGMRFYVNANKIMTPKKLEEVDNINKTAYIL